MDRHKPADETSRKDGNRVCRTCLYYGREAGDPQEHCTRFARFVDHVINPASRDCDYWAPAPSF